MTFRPRWPLIGLVVPVVLLLGIALSDHWFGKTVPLEQRLISRHEAIRQKAQQELLGLPTEYKSGVALKLLDALADPDPASRKWAAISLALIGPSAQAAIPVLLEQVSDKQKEVAQAARVALTEIGAPDPSQLPSLMDALRDSRAAVRCEAAVSISKMGPAGEEAVPFFLGVVQSTATVPSCFVEALADLIGRQSDLVAQVLDLMESPDSTVRRNAMDILVLLPQKSSVTIEGLLMALGSDVDGLVRRRAASGLALPEAPERGLLPALVAGAQRSIEAPVRKTALSLLHEQAVDWDTLQPVLSRALVDQDPDIRLMALTWIRSDDNAPQRFVRGLLARLSDSDPRIRRLALESLALARLRSSEPLRAVAVAQRDADPDVRCLAARLLMDQGSSDRVSIGRFVEDLRTTESPNPCSSEVLTHAALFNPEVVTQMIRLLEDPRVRVRSRAAGVLLPLGSRAKPAIAALTKAQKDGVPGAGVALQAARKAVSHDRRRRS